MGTQVKQPRVVIKREVNTISCRGTRAELDVFKELAKMLGMPTGTFVRNALDQVYGAQYQRLIDIKDRKDNK